MELRENRLTRDQRPRRSIRPSVIPMQANARACSGVRLAEIPESNPFDLPSDWVTSLGTLLHERWQEALQRAYPDALIEPKVQTYLSSGHLDALVTLENGTTYSYELKTINGYGFTQAVGVVKQRGVHASRRKAPRSPTSSRPALTPMPPTQTLPSSVPCTGIHIHAGRSQPGTW